MPEIITTPQALVQTTNGKRFYVYSGVTAVSSAETELIDVENIGERDILLSFRVGAQTNSGSTFLLKIKSNDITVYQTILNIDDHVKPYGFDSYNQILPANSKLTITLTSSSATVNWTLSGHGQYV